MKLRSTEERCLLLAGLLGLCTASGLACGASTEPAPRAPAVETPPAACTNDPRTAENTAAVVAATQKLVAALTPAQQAGIRYDRTLANAEKWSNFPAGFIPRNGIALDDMSDAAKRAAAELAEVAAGTTGATMYSEIRGADNAFALVDRGPPGGRGGPPGKMFGDGLYYVSIHGTPAVGTPWMLQLAGHHFAYNFTYGGACTSATPLFDGAQPSAWTDAAGKHHAPLEAQRAAIAAVLSSVGTMPGAKLPGTFTDMLNGPAAGRPGGTDTNYPNKMTYPKTDRGVNVGALSPEQRARVKTAIEAWVKNVADPVASTLLATYETDDALAQTYIAYSGATDLSADRSYARIDGPRVWIEFTVQEGTTRSEQGHYHTIWRDKLADYGADFVSH